MWKVEDMIVIMMNFEFGFEFEFVGVRLENLA